jgi:hypothetical protein
MDRELREAERLLNSAPGDRRAQLNYLRILSLRAGSCVVQLVAESHRTTDCSGDQCETYIGYPLPDRARGPHEDLTSLNGFFDQLIVNRTAPDHIPFSMQASLLDICDEFCTISNSGSFQPPPGPVILSNWPPYSECRNPVEGDDGINLTCGIPDDNDQVIVREAFVVSQTISQALDAAFLSSLDHFIQHGSERQARRRRALATVRELRAEFRRGRAPREPRDVVPGQRPSNFEFSAAIRGAVAGLLVSRKTAYRESAIARFTVRGVDFT